MRTSIRLTALAAAIVVGIAVPTVPVRAEVPGPNGQILFGKFKPFLDDTATFTVDPDGSDVERFYPGASEDPHWSQDGSKIALLACLNPPTCNTAAAIVDVDSGRVRGLSMPDPTLFTACSVWAPEAHRLACEGLSDNHPRRNGIYSIRTRDGRGLKRITSNPGGEDQPGDYSPDGTQIVFLRTDPDRASGVNQALFVKTIDGGGRRRITPWGLSEEPGSWSPDGTQILFAGNGRLYVVRPDGSDISRIALPRTRPRSFAYDPSWSPDGTEIVFAMYVPGASGKYQSDIYTANADGSDVEQVTDDRFSDHSPDWGSHTSGN
jgi:Tol biopolymer transport system component